MVNKRSSLLKPDMVVHSLSDIPLKTLKKFGICFLLVDIDNTLIPLKEERPSKESFRFVQKAQEEEISVILISNNFKQRVKDMARFFDLPYRGFAMKPLPFVFKKILKEYSLSSNQVAVVGDQIFTDVLGAHLSGLFAIYTEPLSTQDRVLTKGLRVLERRVLNEREKM